MPAGEGECIVSDLLRRLSEVGYMACFKGMVREGAVIMEGIHAMAPDQVPVKIGLAVARISELRYPEAITLLRDEVLAQEPDNLTAKCFLGLALKESGAEAEARTVLEEVRERGDEHQRAIAEAYLQPPAGGGP